MLVSLCIALNGLVWLIWSYLNLLEAPTTLTVIGSVVGVTILGLAWGLWKLNWVAWALTTGGLLIGIWWEMMQLSDSGLQTVPIVQLLIITYLTYKQDLFFASESAI